jgi:anti-sigma B factor antagonist
MVIRSLEGDLPMEFSVRVDHGAAHVVLSATGEVDLATAARFRDAGLAALGIEPTVFVIDLSEVTFMDSTGLGVLVLLRRKSRARRTDLRLVSGRRTDALLKLSGLSSVFEIYPDLASALDEFDDIA